MRFLAPPLLVFSISGQVRQFKGATERPLRCEGTIWKSERMTVQFGKRLSAASVLVEVILQLRVEAFLLEQNGDSVVI